MKYNKYNNINTIPVASYYNMNIFKQIIYKENRNKSGIYRLINIINNKSYVGSSVSLSRRFKYYYSLICLEKTMNKGNSVIHRALLKYGYSNFSLNILEYCEPDVLIKREQYYIDLLNPEYNILRIAGSSLGFKHSEAAKTQMSINNTGKNNPLFNKKHTYETRNKIRESIKSLIRVNNKPKVVTNETKLRMSLRSQGIKVKVFDKSDNVIGQFSSLKKAALYFGVHTNTISRIFKTGKSYNNFTYKFEVKDLRVWVCNENNKLIKILDNAKKTSIWSNVPESTISCYIKSGKLYNNKYYFYNINSKVNSYFGNIED
jgi:group I intron endonuclease